MHRAYASFDKTKKGSMPQRELADLRLTFLVSEETAARKKVRSKKYQLRSRNQANFASRLIRRSYKASADANQPSHKATAVEKLWRDRDSLKR
jgi:hypothetical protein